MTEEGEDRVWAGLICAQCRSPLEGTADTDGHGGLITIVRPCRRCLADIRPVPRAYRRVFAQEAQRRARVGRVRARRPAGLRECACGAPIDYSGRGRPPTRCPACRPPRPRRAPDPPPTGLPAPAPRD